MTPLSNEGTQRIPQKVLTLSREVDECTPLAGGAARHLRGAPPARGVPRHPGRPVQVDPIKPVLKPPGSMLLTLKCDALLSTSAFKFNLRRDTLATAVEVFSTGGAGGGALGAGAYTRSR